MRVRFSLLVGGPLWPSVYVYVWLTLRVPVWRQGGKPKKAEEKDRKEAAADEVVPLMADEGGAGGSAEADAAGADKALAPPPVG